MSRRSPSTSVISPCSQPAELRPQQPLAPARESRCERRSDRARHRRGERPEAARVVDGSSVHAWSSSTVECRRQPALAGWSCSGTRFSHSLSACQWIADDHLQRHQRKAQQRRGQRLGVDGSALHHQRRVEHAVAVGARRRRPQRHAHAPGGRPARGSPSGSRAPSGWNGDTCIALALARQRSAAAASHRPAAVEHVAVPFAPRRVGDLGDDRFQRARRLRRSSSRS